MKSPDDDLFSSAVKEDLEASPGEGWGGGPVDVGLEPVLGEDLGVLGVGGGQGGGEVNMFR